MRTKQTSPGKKVGAADGYALDAEILRKNQRLLLALLEEIRAEAGIGDGHGFKNERLAFFQTIQPYLYHFNVKLGDSRRTDLDKLNDLFVYAKNGSNPSGIKALLSWLCSHNPARAEKIYAQLDYPKGVKAVSFRECPLLKPNVNQVTNDANHCEQSDLSENINHSGFVRRPPAISPAILVFGEEVGELIYFLANMHARVIYCWLSDQRFASASWNLEEFSCDTEFAIELCQDNSRWLKECREQIYPYLELYRSDEKRKILNSISITETINQQLKNFVLMFKPFASVHSYNLMYLLRFELKFDQSCSFLVELSGQYEDSMMWLAGRWDIVESLESFEGWKAFFRRTGSVSSCAYSLRSKVNIFRLHKSAFINRMTEDKEESYMKRRTDEYE